MNGLPENHVGPVFVATPHPQPAFRDAIVQGTEPLGRLFAPPPVDRQRLAEILYAHAFSGSNQNFEMRCHTCDAWIPRPEGVTNFRQHEAIHQAEMIGKALDGTE